MASSNFFRKWSYHMKKLIKQWGKTATVLSVIYPCLWKLQSPHLLSERRYKDNPQATCRHQLSKNPESSIATSILKGLRIKTKIVDPILGTSMGGSSLLVPVRKFTKTKTKMSPNKNKPNCQNSLHVTRGQLQSPAYAAYPVKTCHWKKDNKKKQKKVPIVGERSRTELEMKLKRRLLLPTPESPINRILNE